MTRLTLSLLLMLIGSPLMAEESSRQNILNNVGITQRLNEQIPLSLLFRDETGKTVPLSTYFQSHKPVLLNLVYYECPMLCNEILNGLTRTLRAMPLDAGKDFTIVTVSFDPKETSVLAARKKLAYVDKYKRAGADQGWAFLTGDETSIKTLAEAVGFKYAWDPTIKQYAHGSAIMVVTPEGKMSRYFFGVEYPTQDVRLSLVEASKGKVGSFIDQVMLYCYAYDPATGRYGLIIMRALQLAAVTTLLILAAFVGTMLWSEKHNRMKEKNV